MYFISVHLVYFVVQITIRSRPVGYAAEYLTRGTFTALAMNISPLMSTNCVLYHFGVGELRSLKGQLIDTVIIDTVNECLKGSGSSVYVLLYMSGFAMDSAPIANRLAATFIPPTLFICFQNTTLTI